MPLRRISLASGVLPEHDALTVARAAVGAGYSDAGLMVRADTWNVDDEAELLHIQDADGLGFLDVEVLWIPAGAQLDERHKLVADVGVRLGADHVLVVSDESRPETLAPALATITEWCGPRLRPMLEFLRITEVTSLAQAKELLDACAEHNFGILLDSLHLARSGELNDLPVLDPAMHPYIQLCDAPKNCTNDRESLLVDALDLRSAPGEGELGLTPLMQLLPATTPLSMEVRSKAYRDACPDPTERARAILKRTKKFLEEELDER